MRKCLVPALIGLMLCVMMSAPPIQSQETELVSLSPAVKTYQNPVNPDQYIIRPEESLGVSFLSSRLSSRSFRVDPEGRIVDPVIGVVDVGGLTLSQLRQKLLPILHSAYNADSIVISVKEAYLVSVLVKGEVVRPGRYVGYTSQTVADVIDSAGGLKAGASHRQITIGTATETFPVDLLSYAQLGDIDANPCLYAGNVVTVPSRSQELVRVDGEVVRPTTVELRPGDDLEHLIALAGGVTPYGDMQSATITGGVDGDGTLGPGSMVSVPHKPGFGPVGYVTVTDPELRVTARGLESGTTLQAVLDDQGILKRGGLPGRVLVYRSLLKNPAKRSSRIASWVSQDTWGSYVLESRDSVVVVEAVGQVQVRGDVTVSGLYPFVEGRTVGEYIKNAGGASLPMSKVDIEIYDPPTGLTRVVGVGATVFDGEQIILTEKEELP